MPKIAIDAGHGINTPGKRSPAGEREWSFNNKVVLAAIKYLNQYKNVSILRLDDPTGRTDVPLTTRTSRANQWGADILISVHHNANTGSWGNWTGTETYTYVGSWPQAERLARAVQNRLVKAYGLRDRGLKKADFHMLRESRMPAILTEGGYMDSTIDIKKLRDDKVLDAAGKAVAEGVAEYFGLTIVKPASEPKEDKKKMEEIKKINQRLDAIERRLDFNGKVSEWAKDDWEEVRENGYMDGTDPRRFVRREELAIVVNRIRNNFLPLIKDKE